MAKGVKTGGGSRKGKPNKSTAEVKLLADQYVEKAFKELGWLATNAESEPARVAAIKEILDRRYGKSSQPLDHNLSEGLEALLDRLAAS